MGMQMEKTSRTLGEEGPLQADNLQEKRLGFISALKNGQDQARKQVWEEHSPVGPTGQSTGEGPGHSKETASSRVPLHCGSGRDTQDLLLAQVTRALCGRRRPWASSYREVFPKTAPR